MSRKKLLPIVVGLSMCLVIVSVFWSHTGNRIIVNSQHASRISETIKNVVSAKSEEKTSRDTNASVTNLSVSIKNIFTKSVTNSTVSNIKEDNTKRAHHDEKYKLEFKGLPLIPEIWQYLLEPTDFCEDHISLLVYVHSHAGNIERRQIIRKTWGNNTTFRKTDVVFIVGLIDNVTIQDELLTEDIIYGDILQVKVKEGFYNLTYKTISALHWIDTHCQLKEKYILKTDDDMFINMFSLAELIQPLPKEHLLMCRTWRDALVMRHNKYKVSYEEYKFKFYPDFCSGSAYLMTQDVVHGLHLASLNRNPFKLDDVYVTGLLRHHIDIALRDETKVYLLDNLSMRFTNNKGLTEQFISTSTTTGIYVFLHLHNLTEYEPLWQIILKRNSELNMTLF